LKGAVVFINIPQNRSGALECVCGLVEDLGGTATTDEQSEGVTHFVTTYGSLSQSLALAREHCNTGLFFVSVDWVISCYHHFERLDETLFYMPANLDEAEKLLNHLIEHQTKCTHPLLKQMKTPVSEMELECLSDSERGRLKHTLDKSFLNLFESRVSTMVESIKCVNSMAHNQLEESVGPILVLAIGFLQRMPREMDIEMYKLRIGGGCHVEPQSSPLFDGARGKNGDTAVLQQMFVAGEFIPGFSDVNSNMGNLSMALDTQYYGAPVNRHLPIRRELSPSDSLKHENFAKVSSSIFIFK